MKNQSNSTTKLSYGRKNIALRLSLCIAIVAALLLATWEVFRLTYADYLSSASSLAERRTATRMFPGNAEFLIRLIALEEHDKRDIHADLLSAVAANPSDASMWVLLGTDSEVHGNYAEAEKQFIEGTRMSTTFAPRMALSKCYYEAGDRRQCEYWLRQALKIATPDPTDGFWMARRLGMAPAEVLSLIPKDDKAVISYLNFLNSQQDLAGALPVANVVLRNFATAGKQALLDYAIRLASGGPAQTEQAAAVWNEMVSAGLLNGQKIFPAGPARIVNGDFHERPTGNAFDWRSDELAGVILKHSGEGLQFLFDGSQPETCNLLWQMISVKPDQTYALTYHYAASGLATPSGLSWHVYDSVTLAEITKQSLFLTDHESQQTVTFRVPQSCRFPELVLSYARQLGTERSTGFLTLKRVQITPQP